MWRSVLAVLCGVSVCVGAERFLPADDSWQASGLAGIVVTGGPGPQAARAGLDVLKEGGNAVDAAASTLLVLSVIDSGNFCFGGEVPILAYDSNRKLVEVLAGQGAAPELATLAHFQALGGIPQKGPEAAAVPGAVDAILTALERSGTIRFARAAQPMLAILDERSDAASRDLSRTVREMIAAEESSPDRRRGLRLAADYFYRGPVARRIDAWSRANGGLLRYSDLARHVTRIEDPVTVDYRGLTVVKCGAWTQGPCLLQSLRILEGYDLKSLGPTQAEYIHLAVETLKLTLADRDAYYADPLFVDVPLTALLSTSYAAQRRSLVDRQRASREQRPGEPLAAVRRLPVEQRIGASTAPAGVARDTTTCLVADQFGNVVAATPSGWGGVVAGDTGVLLGSRLRSLNTIPGHPNCVAPGKRPRITLTPTLVLRAGQPVLAISVAGGDLQDQVSLQLLIDCVDFGRSPAEAVTLPRFSTSHHVGSFSQPPPKLGQLSINEEVGAVEIAKLKALGHDVELAKPPIGHPCVLRLDPATGRKEGAGDPSAKRQAAAY